MPRLHISLLLIGGALLILLLPSSSSAKPGYYRDPDIHGDRIVFASEGDLWIVPAGGGSAQRLTSHPGSEYFPKFSPDGKTIAFTGEYDGNQDVFVMDTQGGEPRRLTWHPGSDQVLGWTPDGTKVLYRSNMQEPNHNWEIYSVPAAGGDPEKLPIGWAARLDIDSASGMWAFNRSSWETATWKRYRGGTAPDIWAGDPKKQDFHQVTTFTGSDAFPMWHEGRIYYLCDQGGTFNLWSILPDGTDAKQLTQFKEWDARFPSMGPDGRIVFSMAADIYLFDPKDGASHKVDVDLPSDRVLTRERYPNPSQYITGFTLAPDGDRLAVEARGEIFSVPVKDGVTLPVTHGSGARERGATFDPKGKQIVFISDATKEEDIRVMDAWGRGEAKIVKPAGKTGWHFTPVFSPDGKWIAYADQTMTLYIVPAGGGQPVTVDHSTQSEISRYSWSPDGRWLAYDKARSTEYSGIHIYDTKTQKILAVTGASTDDFDPSWDPDGRYLYFLSNRATNPLLGTRDWDNIEAKSTKPYMVLLRKDVKNPMADLEGLPPDGKEDAKAEAKTEDKDKGKDKEKKDEAPKPVEIDADGLADRVVELPVDYGNYFGIDATSKTVFFLSAPLKGFAEQGGLFEEEGPDNTLMSFDLEKKKAKSFMEGVGGYSLAAKSNKIAVMKGHGEIYVVGTDSPPGDLGDAKVSLDGMVIDLDPREEWAQIYYEGWRHERDFFWDPGMGGLNWQAIRDQYATLLPRLSSRDDLRDLLGEIIGELGNSHTYVWGGDPGKDVTHVSTGLLGADVVREGSAYRISRIYRGDPADQVRSPLRDPGVNVSEGEYILAVNHSPFEANRPFTASFENLAGKEVVLTVSDKASGGASRDVVVKTIPGEGSLRYADWVRHNREYVAEKTGGKIGYVHIPDMWKNGLIQFNTWFYPQLDKEGMVVDARWNGGGAVSQMIVERFRRHLVSFDRSRAGGISTYPNRVLNGPFVVLTNQFAGSDGDIFPMVVQLEKLAPVIGMRTWGGVVGIRGDKPLVDGGMLTQPEFAWWDPGQGWSLENRGVIPDIEIENQPQDLAKGKDAQLDRAIEEVMKLHEAHPPVVPKFGPVRDRTRAVYLEKEVAGAKPGNGSDSGEAAKSPHK
jgi:tricorn protease